MPSVARMNSNDNDTSSQNNNTSNASSNNGNNHPSSIVSRRGRASPIGALSAASSAASKRMASSSSSLSHNNGNKQGGGSKSKRPRTQKLYHEDHAPSNIALTAANVAAGIYRCGSNVSCGTTGTTSTNTAGNGSNGNGKIHTTTTRSHSGRATMGTATAIHFAKPVFRFGSNGGQQHQAISKRRCYGSDDEDEDCGRILLTLSKTPPTSFDERDKISRHNQLLAVNGRQPASSKSSHPENPSSPPQLHKAHNNGSLSASASHLTSPGTLFPLESSPNLNMLHSSPHTFSNLTPGGAGSFGIEMGSSFGLFNPPSFDSLSENIVGQCAGLQSFMTVGSAGNGVGSRQPTQLLASPIETSQLGSSSFGGNSIDGPSVMSGFYSNLKNLQEPRKDQNMGISTKDNHAPSIQPRPSPLTFPNPPITLTLPNKLPQFYTALFKYREAFTDFTYVLPGLRKAMSYNYGDVFTDTLSADDLKIAKRRVRSAICAFGGGHIREKDRKNLLKGSTSKEKSAPRKYDQMLLKRFQESDEGRLSWDVESDPPVEVSQTNHTFNSNIGNSKSAPSPSPSVSYQASLNTKISLPARPQKNQKAAPTPSNLPSNAKGNANKANSGGKSGNNTTPKMRYRCKLCGQPKQNHICPYAQVVQRSIGTQIYPAVNAFTAHEPGMLSQSLVEMNGFAYAGSESSPPHPRHVRASPVRSSRVNGAITDSAPPSTPFNPTTITKVTPETPTVDGASGTLEQISGARSRDALFVDSLDLRVESYKVVTSSNIERPDEESYRYPKIPLAFIQRKRLSDYLFSLTKERKGLTDETADILRSGRENDEFW
eukprot:CAMPEP_0116057200 /NCGR_PEP_ID=MMETSP0322-20121206/4465_1 /TAXON_ID=163516 /ORGANISM="Leptocylindrus danicus var. apora, Strain B651" /LENGTH=825 /DNA_ID=CAMNT_0003541157 /DNA_START=108 /DNA_END=2582 /DNA_ORIENTATION=-